MEEKRKTTEKIHECSEGQQKGWSDRAGCGEGYDDIEADDLLSPVGISWRKKKKKVIL